MVCPCHFCCAGLARPFFPCRFQLLPPGDILSLTVRERGIGGCLPIKAGCSSVLLEYYPRTNREQTHTGLHVGRDMHPPTYGPLRNRRNLHNILDILGGIHSGIHSLFPPGYLLLTYSIYPFTLFHPRRRDPVVVCHSFIHSFQVTDASTLLHGPNPL